MKTKNPSNRASGNSTTLSATEPTAQQFSKVVKLARESSSSSGLLPCRGDLCLAPVMFTDGSDIKIRPTVVIGVEGSDLVVLRMTSRPPRREFEVELLAWAKSGLWSKGTVQCSKIIHIPRDSVVKRIGRLSYQDWKQVLNGIRCWFRTMIVASRT
jgi:mRNA-degrading endonuclease toxin of MazEF toxin-antitoxin module